MTKYSTFLLSILVFIVLMATLYAQGVIATAEEVPWYQQVDKFRDTAVAWITAIGVVLTALIGMVFMLWMMVRSKFKELSGKSNLALEALDARERRQPVGGPRQQDVEDAVIKINAEKKA